MASVNKVILVGRLGKDPEVRYMTNGEAVANFSVATTDNWKDKDGKKQERTEWHNIVMYRKLAEIAKEYLAKGSLVFLSGALRTRQWEKDGVKHYSTEVIADHMQMLSSKDNGRKSEQKPAPANTKQDGFDDLEWMDDDIPF